VQLKISAWDKASSIQVFIPADISNHFYVDADTLAKAQLFYANFF